MKLEKLKQLIDKRSQLESDIEKEIRKTFIIGSYVNFQKGNSKVMNGMILMRSCFEDRLKIKSETGKEYWIDIYHVLKCY